MKNIILLGAPGTGKGTQAENIEKWYGIPQISTGAIFRANIKSGTELGKTAQKYIETGALVPDELTIKLVADRLSQADCAGGFILDGFPRSVPQAEALDAYLGEGDRKLSVVASIYVDDETIVTRLSGRRVCADCNKTYHLVYTPPTADGICDACGGKLAQRDDDREETIRGRLAVYYSQTEPLIERYRAQGLFIRITGRERVEDTSAEMAAALKSVFSE
jgi:adenylate kinase